MRILSLTVALLLTCSAAALADPPTRAITVGASASVEYVPDIAHIELGVAAEAPTAADASSAVNRSAQNVIAALRRTGIPDRGLQTSNFSLTLRPARVDHGVTVAPAAYAAQLTIDVTTSVDKIGSAIDEAIRAGANRSYNLGFDSSRSDQLYLQALAAATAQARARAEAIARAAGVNLDALITVNTSGGPLRPLATMGRVAAAAMPIAPGTKTVDATVEAVYGIH